MFELHMDVSVPSTRQQVRQFCVDALAVFTHLDVLLEDDEVVAVDLLNDSDMYHEE